MKTLHQLPRFEDRGSYLYLERGILDQEASGLVLHTAGGDTPLPIDQLRLLQKPGTRGPPGVPQGFS